MLREGPRPWMAVPAGWVAFPSCGVLPPQDRVHRHQIERLVRCEPDGCLVPLFEPRHGYVQGIYTGPNWTRKSGGGYEREARIQPRRSCRGRPPRCELQGHCPGTRPLPRSARRAAL